MRAPVHYWAGACKADIKQCLTRVWKVQTGVSSVTASGDLKHMCNWKHKWSLCCLALAGSFWEGHPVTAQRAKTPINPAKKESQNGTGEWVLLHQAAETQELPGRSKTSSTNSCSSEKDCHLKCKKSQGKWYHFNLNNVYPHLPGRSCQMPEGLSVWKRPEVFTIWCCFRSATAAQVLCFLIRRPFFS